MTKAELRKIYKAKRNEISVMQKEKLQDIMLINFQQIQLPFVSFLHTYIASEKHAEFETDHVIRYLEFINPDLKTAAPKIEINGTVTNYLIDVETEFTVNDYGIAEPAGGEVIPAQAFDVALIPLLIFDKNGNRVGFGKGYYDRFLADCRSDIIKIGFSFFEPDATPEDINEFDIPLNYCVTPEQVYHF